MVFLLFALLPSFVAFTGLAPTPAAAVPIAIVDDAGPDDEPGQKDLNQLTVDFDSGAADIEVTWNWDVISVSGANTGDACSLYDTDNDGNANYSLCVIWDTNSNYQTTRLYVCGDGAADKCDQPRDLLAEDMNGDGDLSDPGEALIGGPYASTCSISVVSDTFGARGGAQADTTSDTQATCLIELDDFGGGDAFLTNVCSYPSQIPGSDPSDCVISPNSGFLTLVKVADPNDGTAFQFDLGAGQAANNGETSFTIFGSGSIDLIGFAPGTTYDLTEVVPANFALESAECVLSDGTATGSFSGETITDFEIQIGRTTTCTFTNGPANGSLTLVKTVDNLGESGPGYLDVSDFPLTIDGSPTTSGDQVVVLAGDHTIAETPQAGYTVGQWVCDDPAATTGAAGDPSLVVNVPAGVDVTCSITNTLDANLDLGITKTITGVDTAGDGILNAVGDLIEYEIVATNNGNVTLTNVVVSDPLLGTLNCTPTQPTSLAPSATITCTGSYAITQADLDSNATLEPDNVLAGQLDNTATADADGIDPVTASADEPLAQNPSLAISKVVTAIDGDPAGTADSVGDLIEYQIVVTNDGNVALTPTVTDVLTQSGGSQPLTLTGPTESISTDGEMQPTETWTYTASYAITQADLDAGTDINNQACAANTDPAVAEVCDDVDTPVNQNASLIIDKTVTGVDAAGDTILNEAGDIIDYQIVATNNGNTTLTNVTVSDPLLGTLDCTPTQPATLAPMASITCTGSYAISQADLDTDGDGDGNIDNTAVADSDQTDPVQDSEMVPLAPAAELTILKQVDSIDNPDSSDGGSVVDEAGDVINYEITVTNSGNVTLTNVIVSDPLLVTVTCDPAQPATLAPGEFTTCTGSYTVLQSDIDDNGGGDGDIDNTATADSDQTGEATADAFAPLTQAPALVITKEATAIDTAGDGALNAAGDVVGYTIVVTNDGNQTLTNVQVTDPLLSSLDCSPAQPATLAPTESMTCTGSYTLTQADIDSNATAEPNNVVAGLLDNTATVTSDEAGPETATEQVPVAQDPSVVLSKTASQILNPDGSDGGSSVNEANDQIVYTITVENTGNQSLTNVVVTDPLTAGTLVGPISGDDINPGVLDVGETWTYQATYTVSQADIDSGGNIDLDDPADGDNDAIHNEACVATEEGATDCDTEDVPVDENPVLEIVKTVSSITSTDGAIDESTVDAAGDIINYSMVVTNTGNQTLTNVQVSDPLVGTLDCTPALGSSLAPGETMTCTGSYTVLQSDIDTDGGGDGMIENTATADSDESAPDDDSADVPIDQEPLVAITKTASQILNSDGSDGGSSVNEAGDQIVYTITVDNTGNQSLTGVVVSDPLLGGVLAGPDSGDGPVVGVLEVDETWTYTAIYTVSQGDIDAGGNLDLDGDDDNDVFQNEACVVTAEGATDCDTEDVPVDENPALEILKEFVSITDPGGGDGGTTVDEAGDVINYRITVTNTGNQTLTNVTVDDSLLDNLVCDPADDPLSLLPGDDVVCTGSYTVLQSDIDDNGGGDGDIDNTATADSDQTDPDDSSVAVPLSQEPLVAITKTASQILNSDGSDGGSSVNEAGDQIVYTITVDNTGNQSLTGVVVSDPLLGGVLAGPDSGDGPVVGVLEVDETWTYTAIYTVSQGDIDAGGNLDLDGDDDNDVFQNEACVVTAEGATDCDTEDVPVDENPALQIVKTVSSITSTDGADGESTVDAAGDIINYSMVVTNTGNQTLTNVQVSDPLVGALDCDPALGSSLLPGEMMTCTGSYEVTQDDIDTNGGGDGLIENVATADSDESAPDDDDADVPVDQEPALQILKEFVSITDPGGGDGGDTVDEAGDVINYRITVTNTGNQTLTNVLVSDPLIGDLDCVPADNPLSLAPGDDVVCTGSYTVLQSDIDDNGGGDGDIDNTATADSDQTDPADSSVEVPVDRSPSAAVVKSTDVESYSAVGDIIDYTIEVINDGNASLSIADIEATLTDEVNGVDKTADLVGPSTDAAGANPVGAGDTLAPGDSWYYTYSYTIVEADLDDQDTVTNVVCVDVDGDGVETCSQVETPSAGLAIEKSVLTIDGVENGQADSAGDIIKYQVIVTNTGAIDLRPSVSDVLTQSGLPETLDIGEPTESQGDDDLMEPTETWTYVFDYELLQADIDDGGDLINEACAVSVDPAVDEVCAEVITPVVQNPKMTILKEFVSITNPDGTDGGDTADERNDVINYRITVTNSGNQTLTDVQVSDPLVGTLDCNPALGSSLAPAQSMVCTGSYTVTQADIDSDGGGDGDIDNLATGDSDQTDPVDDTEEVPVDRSPAIAIDKTVVSVTNLDGTDGGGVIDAAGDVVTYSIEVENTGNTTLTGVTITDPLLADLLCPPSDILNPGDIFTCSGTYTVLQSDIDSNGTLEIDNLLEGQLDNTATADSDETDPVQDSQQVPVIQDPKMTILKEFVSITNPGGGDGGDTADEAGDVINYRITVSNSGNQTLTNVQVSDPLIDDLTCTPDQPSVLAPDASMTCTGSYDGDAGRHRFRWWRRRRHRQHWLLPTRTRPIRSMTARRFRLIGAPAMTLDQAVVEDRQHRWCPVHHGDRRGRLMWSPTS